LMPASDEKQFRCKNCRKLLGLENSHLAVLEIKCNRCDTFNRFTLQGNLQVIVTDREGVIVYANDLVSQTTGYNKNEIIGSRPSLWGKQMSKGFYARLWKRILGKQETTVQLTNKRKDGSSYQAVVTIVPIADKNGSIKHFLGMTSSPP